MKLKLIATLLYLPLAACVGGGGASSPSAQVSQAPATNSETLGVFPDGSGLVRTVATNDDTLYIFVNDISELATTLQTSGLEGSSLVVGSLTVPVTGSIDSVAILGLEDFTGTIATIRESGTGPIRILETTNGEAFIAAIGPSNNPNTIVTRGASYGAAPPGEHTYRGAMTAHTRIGGEQVVDGQFTLIADFDNQAFTLTGFIDPSSPSYTFFSSNGTIDNATGHLQATTATLGANPATLYGSLHGATAGAVSGIFHTNEASPVTVGAFAGSRWPAPTEWSSFIVSA